MGNLNIQSQAQIINHITNSINHQPMQPDNQPNPKRFEVFTQLPNGRGFRIKDSKYIYLFDKNGGWFDQYNNYYNSNGDPEEPPIDQDEDFERVLLAQEFDQQDDDDYFDREYGVHAQEVHDYNDDHNGHQKTLESIANNQAILLQHPVKTPLRVHFSNMTFKATKQDILKHYRLKIGNGILNVMLTQESGKFNGNGTFICKEVSVAEKLIKYEAEEFLGRKVYFNVETVEECLADPVRREEMDIPINEDDFESLVKQQPKAEETKEESKTSKKKYFAKGQTVEQPKQQPKPSVTQTQQSPVQKQQPIKKQEKKEPTWSKYHADVTMFPKKISFKEWMNSQGFKENEHFKNPEKADSTDSSKRFATVELRSDVYDKIEGSLYEGQQVHFQFFK